MLAHALRWTIAGVIVGIAAGAGVVRLVRNLFFHVTVENPLLFGAVASLMILIAILAAWKPALAAARIDPIIALRHE
jgi:putative ABC transport system permease protein